MARSPAPFAAFEFMIAWRYLRARRAEGGVSVMTWISVIGISLAVFALVATLAVRAGLRTETLRIILGANAHVEMYYSTAENDQGGADDLIRDYADLAARLNAVEGVAAAVPVVKAQIIGTHSGKTAPIELIGIAREDLSHFPSVAVPERAFGSLERFEEGIALADGLARALGAHVGDRIRIISPDGAATPFGTKPRISAYEVVYVFRSGHGFVDGVRAYLPLSEAQPYLNRDGAADQIQVLVDDPEAVERYGPPLLQAGGARAYLWTWRDRSGGFLRALALQDNALFILLSILVLIAAMNIVSGLIMLVKNKGRDIGILRTMGLTEGSILRVFFLVGSLIGAMGTGIGVGLGVLFSANIEHVYALMDLMTGQGRGALEAQGFFFPPAEVRLSDVIGAIALSLGLSFVVTWFPARRAARMNPVEALRYE